jgi:anti-sigma factor RsiW
MNVTLEGHVPEDSLEAYAMGRLSGEECVLIEEHLLICPTCQRDLEAVDDYIQVTRAAIAALAPQPPARIGPQPAWSLRAAMLVVAAAGWGTLIEAAFRA